MINFIKTPFHNTKVKSLKVASKFLPKPRPKISWGQNSISSFLQEIKNEDIDKILIVTDKGLVEIGIIGEISKKLTSLGIECFIYDQITPNPTFDQIDNGKDVYIGHQCQAILAVGGGSPLDAAKVMSLSISNKKDSRKMVGLYRSLKGPVPLFALPTTAGTGSEVTMFSVISDDVQKHFIIDHRLIPKAACLEPNLMLGLPKHITAATGIDALTHAIEAYLSKSSDHESDNYAKLAIRLIFKNLPIAFSDGNNVSAREKMSLASYYAGLAFGAAGVGYVHAIAHQFSAYYNTPHGLANAITLPHILRFYGSSIDHKLSELNSILKSDVDSNYNSLHFIENVETLLKTVEIPNKLKELSRDDCNSISKRALKEAFGLYPVPKMMNHKECKKILLGLIE